jgi:DNA-binding transcriptional regulator YiaG
VETSNLAVARLIGEVKELTAVVRDLVKHTPHRTKTWLEPSEMASLLGVSTRTLQNWRSTGRFKPGSYRKGPKGYQFHGESALRDAQEVA